MAFTLRIFFLLCTHMNSTQASSWKPLFQVKPIWVNYNNEFQRVITRKEKTIILPPQFHIPHLQECIFHLFRFLASTHQMVYNGYCFGCKLFWHLVPLSIILQYWHVAHAMIWEWRLIMSLSLKSGTSKILRHLVTSTTINLEKHIMQ